MHQGLVSDTDEVAILPCLFQPQGTVLMQAGDRDVMILLVQRVGHHAMSFGASLDQFQTQNQILPQHGLKQSLLPFLQLSMDTAMVTCVVVYYNDLSLEYKVHGYR